jgi:hypothetical protein
MKTTTKTKEVNIKGMEMKRIVIPVKGFTPFISHNFDEKALRIIQEIQNKTKTGRAARDPEQEYIDSIYWIDKESNRSGFPAVGFKAAMVRAAKQMDMAMTDVRGRFHVLGTDGQYVEIKGEHRMRTDMVRVANGGTDIRYRAEYTEWSAEVTIVYNSASISEVQLLKLMEIAGFACGIGEWRPEKANTGSYGMWVLDV